MPPTAFSCYVIGSETLLLSCTEELLARGHLVLGVISDAGAVTDWCAARGVRVVSATADYVAVLSERPFDLLLSITNLDVVPAAAIAMARRGGINFHDGPLPRYGGLHAPAWALMAREHEHGITWHWMTSRPDAGDIVLQRRVPIADGETSLSLNAKCFEAGVSSFAELVDLLASDTVPRVPHSLDRSTYHGISDRPSALAALDWGRPAAELDALVRALDFGVYPNPLARAKIVMRARAIGVGTLVVRGPATAPAGTVVSADDAALQVATADRVVSLSRLTTPEGGPLTPREALEVLGAGVGDRLSPLAEELVVSCQSFMRDASRFEGAWSRRLASLAPLELPQVQGATGRGARHGSIDTTRIGDREATLRAVLVLLGSLSGRAARDVAFREAGSSAAHPVLAPLVSARVPLRIELPDAATMGVARRAAADALDWVRRRVGFARDLVARRPVLRALAGREFALPVTIECAETLDAAFEPVGDLTVVLARDGTCRWHYDTDRLSEADVRALAGRLGDIMAAPDEAEVMQVLRAHAHPGRGIDFSLFYFSADEGEATGDRYQLLLDGARFGDANGFSAVWTPERHFHAFGGLYPNPSVTSAAVAAITSRIGVRGGSCVLPLHHPVRVVEEWSVVDNLSRGRVGIAFAAGWQPDDFILQPSNYADAKLRTVEMIETVRRLWRGESVPFPGPRGEVAVRTLPRPVQRELPVWFTTAGNPESFETAGRLGANVLTHLLGQSLAELAERIAIYRRARHSAGHAGPGQVALMLHTFVGEDAAEVKELVRAPMKRYLSTSISLIKGFASAFPTFKRRADGTAPALDFASLSPDEMDALLDFSFERYHETSSLFGTVEQCAAMVERLREIGVDEIACLIDFGVAPARVLRNLPHLARLRARVGGSSVSATLPAEPRPLRPDADVSGSSVSAPRPEARPVPRPESPVPRLAGPDGLEPVIAGIWQEILKVPRIDRDDDFFDLGGHSLLAVQVHSRLKRSIGLDFSIADLFRHPTVRRLAAFFVATGAPVADEALPVPDTLAATPMQEGIWAAEQARPGTTVDHQIGVRHLRGALDAVALERAVTTLFERHDALRMSVRVIDGLPTLVRTGIPGTTILHLDSSGDPAQDDATLRSAAAVPFDLATGPVLRFTLLRRAESEHLLLMCAHHILVDGNSLSVLWRELFEAYAAVVEGREWRPAPAPSFARWAMEYRRLVDAGAYDAQLAHWRAVLGDPPVPIELGTGEGAEAPPFEGGTVTVSLPKQIVRQIEENRFASTPFVLLLTALQGVLHRYTGATDIAVAVPALLTTGDGRAETGVGMYINTQVLRASVDPTAAFATLAERNRRTVLDAWANREFPFSKVVERLRPPRATARNPYYQVLLSFELADTGATGTIAGLELSRHPIERAGSQADLAIYVRWERDEAVLTIDFDATVLSKSEVERFARHLVGMLEAGLGDAHEAIGSLTYLDRGEQDRLTRGVNATARPSPPTTVPARIGQRVREGLHRAAVTQDAVRLTYGELWARAGSVAKALRARGVMRGSVVGLSVDRTPSMVVALLGIWRAGAAYLPLDVAFPRERLAFMSTDARCALVLHDGRWNAVEGVAAELLETLEAEGAAIPGAPSEATDDQTALAYVLYTSGSTGRPKGVEVAHGSLSNFLDSMAETPGIGAEDVLFAVTTLSFDIAGLELWLPLWCGARVELASSAESRDPDLLSRRLRGSGATMMQATPATWRMLLESGWEGRLRGILCGGEAFPLDLVEPLRRRASALWNLYGPTETTIWSTVARLDTIGSMRSVPVGRPIANTRVYVMDAGGQLAATGRPGELWIAGDGVARGYRGRPDLTAERFVRDPFVDGARAYRTGDLGRWNADGMLEHLGRLDQQVKVNGFRIELGEIEAALARVPEIRHAVVDVRGSATDRRLVAYAVFDPAATSVPSATELRRALRETLPEYMVPSLVVRLDAVPLTPNGKVDRRALPDPFVNAASGRPQYEAPASALERTVAGIWRELLGVDRVGRHDNFFELGGHSLLALQVVWRVERTTGRRLDPRAFFFSSLSRLVEGAG